MKGGKKNGCWQRSWVKTRHRLELTICSCKRRVITRILLGIVAVLSLQLTVLTLTESLGSMFLQNMVTFCTNALYQTTHTTTSWTVTTVKTWRVILIFVRIGNCTSKNLMQEGAMFTLILRWSPSQPSICWKKKCLCSTCLTSRSIMRWILSDFLGDELGDWCCHLVAADANSFFSVTPFIWRE